MRNITQRAVAVGASLLTIGGIFAVLGGTADAATVYTQNGAYQFAASSGTVSASNEFSNSPLSYSDASQTLGANGVNLSAGPNADAGVVFPLGRLDSLFNADGKFVPPAIVGSGLEGYNLYVDTNGSDTYLGFPNDAEVYLDHGASDTPLAYDGTNKLAMGAVGNANAAATGVDCVWTGQNSTVIPAATCAITMAQVKLDFASNPDGDVNPLVWAWIGVGDAATEQTGYVTSVDGVNLVTATVTPPPPPPSGLIASQKLAVGTHALAVDDTLGTLADGNPQQAWESSAGSNGNPVSQQWTVVSKGGYDVIEMTSDTNFCLDVKGFGTTDGTKIQLWACNGGADQKWAPQADGTLEAVNATSVSGHAMVLDDPSGKGNGTKLQIWERGGLNGSNGNLNNQLWTTP